MLIHSVYFWLEPDLTTDELAAFAEGLRSLEAIDTVKTLHIGRPAPSDRPVVESSYTFGLIIGFDDLQGLEAYQVHPIHIAFVEEFKPRWVKIQVFDVV